MVIFHSFLLVYQRVFCILMLYPLGNCSSNPPVLLVKFHEISGDVARHGVEKPATMWSCANARAAKPEAAAPQSAAGGETTGQKAAIEVTFIMFYCTMNHGYQPLHL